MVNAQNKHVIQHFGGMLALKRSANICCGQISKDVQRSAGGRYANIFGQISPDVQRSFKQLSAGVQISAVQLLEDVQRSLGRYQWKCKDCEYLLANIRKTYQPERTAGTRRECDAR